ncbi:putative DD41D transposase [Trichonephila clavipes]|nr:putative DD41D transposase [Trichonephila clavipes]
MPHEDTIHLQISMSSPGFEPRPNGKAVSVTNHRTGWAAYGLKIPFGLVIRLPAFPQMVQREDFQVSKFDNCAFELVHQRKRELYHSTECSIAKCLQLPFEQVTEVQNFCLWVPAFQLENSIGFVRIESYTLSSTTAVATFSMLEDGICFRPLPGRMLSCPVDSSFCINLSRAYGDIGHLRVHFVRRNSFSASTDRVPKTRLNGDQKVCEFARIKKEQVRVFPQKTLYHTYHTARATIDLLEDTFGDHLISGFGPVNWPPKSCDLTPLEYFLWGFAKSLVYADKPQTLDHLEDNIRHVIADIRLQMLEKVIENWTSRLDYIRASRGSPMPEIIFKM